MSHPGRDKATTLLVYTTLYPNAAQPRRGLFVERRLLKLTATNELRAVVVAPVPWFPFRHPRFGRFAVYAAVPGVEERDGIRVYHPRYLGIPGLSQYLAPLFLFLGTYLLCWRLSRREGVDLVDAHYLYPDAVAAAVIALALRKPLVATARGTDLNLLPENSFCRALIRFAGRHSAAVITVSEALKARAVEVGLDADKLVTLRNGVDTDVFVTRPACAARKRLGLPIERTVLLSVGNLVENKGHHLIIEALPRLPEASLVIVGEGDERGSLERQVEERGLTHRVRFAGPVEPDVLIDYYAAADVLVLASGTEGMPNVVLEALSCGLAVVSTDCGGVREIIREPLLGKVVEERTAAAIGDGAGELLKESRPRDAIRRVAQQFDWRSTIDHQRRLYRAVLRGGPLQVEART